MLILENILLAFAGLKANKMRAALTMLGIIIGISSVIAITIAGDAVNHSVMTSMEDMGAGNISVSVQQKDDGSGEYQEIAMKPKDFITNNMVEKMTAHFDSKIKTVGLSEQAGSGKAKEGKNYANIDMLGVNQGYLKSNKPILLSGRLFTDRDQQESKRVALVSDKFAENVFHKRPEEVIGKRVDIEAGNKYYNYTIIGVYKYQKPAYSIDTVSDRERKTNFYLPLKTVFLQNRKESGYRNIDVVAGSGVDSGVLADEISGFMNETFYKDNQNFTVSAYSMEAMMAETKNMLSMIQKAIAGAAAISLLVGGIGVMNIMIVSITERTKEIGTRKALGATNGFIRLQFITEAIVICLAGGLLGIGLGLGAGLAGAKIMGYHGSVSIKVILGCLLFSFVFGIFFGFYPADHAAKMDPIEALRYE